MLLCAGCAFAQKKDLRYEKDQEWAKWVFTSIEFHDDYTTVRGHFIPGENGCWVSTSKAEVLQANGKDMSTIAQLKYGNRNEAREVLLRIVAENEPDKAIAQSANKLVSEIDDITYLW